MKKTKSARAVVHISELSTHAMAAGNEARLTKVDDDGDLKEWVGIGWVTLESTKCERLKWPKVIR